MCLLVLPLEGTLGTQIMPCHTKLFREAWGAGAFIYLKQFRVRITLSLLQLCHADCSFVEKKSNWHTSRSAVTNASPASELCLALWISYDTFPLANLPTAKVLMNNMRVTVPVAIRRHLSIIFERSEDIRKGGRSVHA